MSFTSIYDKTLVIFLQYFWPNCCPIVPQIVIQSYFRSEGGRETMEGGDGEDESWTNDYKDTKPYMSAFLSVDLLTDFAAFCLTDFIDWRYIHSWFVFSTQLVNCCTHGRRNYMILVYCCPSTVPSLWPPSPPPLPNVQYIQTVCDCGGGGCWNVLWTIFCRSFTLCFWLDWEPTKLPHHPKQKWPVKTTLKDRCLKDPLSMGWIKRGWVWLKLWKTLGLRAYK